MKNIKEQEYWTTSKCSCTCLNYTLYILHSKHSYFSTYFKWVVFVISRLLLLCITFFYLFYTQKILRDYLVPELHASKMLNVENTILLSRINILTLFRMGRGDKKVPLPVLTLYLPQTYKLAPKTFKRLVLTLLTHWCKIPRPYLVPLPNYWTWTKTTLQKNWFFRSNPYKIEVMITFLIEMLELPNFGHVTTPAILLSHNKNDKNDKNLMVTSWTKFMTS